MIGVVGASSRVYRRIEAIEGVEVRAGDAEDLLSADPDVFVAVGERAVSSLVRAGVCRPILPVAAGDGLDSVQLDRAPAAVVRVAEGDFLTREHPVIGVSIGDGPIRRGVFDAMVVTSEPARISEYSIETSGGTDRFRADGVIVATPAGSHGYARAVGGPLLDADAGAVAVVPVAPFVLQSTVRVGSTGASVSIRVERDEGDVSLLVDGEPCGEVPVDRSVSVEVVDAVETVGLSRK